MITHQDVVANRTKGNEETDEEAKMAQKPTIDYRHHSMRPEAFRRPNTTWGIASTSKGAGHQQTRYSKCEVEWPTPLSGRPVTVSAPPGRKQGQQGYGNVVPLARGPNLHET